MTKHVASTITGRAIRAVTGQAQGGDGRIVRFVFGTPGVARDGHRILPGAWQSQGHDGLAAFKRNPVFLWAHESDELPIGRVDDIGESDGVLSGGVRFADHPFADTCLQLYRQGFLNACSVGWLPVAGKRATEPGRDPGAYDFSKVELLEISAVPVPADADALATARAAGIDLAPIAEWASRRLDMKDSKMPVENLEAFRRAAGGAAAKVYATARSTAPAFRSFGEQCQAIMRASSGDVDSRLIRAPLGGNEVDPSGGGFLVQDTFVEELVESLYAESVLAPMVDRRVTSKPLATVKIPAVDETSRADGSRWGATTSYWAAESASVSASFPRFRELQFSAKKLIALCYASGELLDDAPMLGAHLTRAFAAEMGFKLDHAIFRGAGAGTPLGVLHGPSTITIAKENGQAPATILSDNVRKMWSALPAPCRKRAVWIVNEDVEGQLDQSAGGFSGLYMPAGTAGNAAPLLKGRPVIPIEQASVLGTVGDIVLADLSEYIAVMGDLKTAVSAHVQFVSDQLVFRFTLRVDGMPAWASPITAYNGSGTRSPFIALAAR